MNLSAWSVVDCKKTCKSFSLEDDGFPVASYKLDQENAALVCRSLPNNTIDPIGIRFRKYILVWNFWCRLSTNDPLF